MKLILVGGFLSSGKTTAISHAALLLNKADRRVGVITNDQGEFQVDSAFIKHLQIAHQEIGGGCFCCNYEDLSQAIQLLNKEARPELIFAESVGSCTDLVATVINPLARFYPKINTLVVIFIDGKFLIKILKGEVSFLSENIRYIYKKQLEEADVFILNKCDLLDDEQVRFCIKNLQSEFPGKKILPQISLIEKDIQQFIHLVDTHMPNQPAPALDIDYQIYALGEAELAWYDGHLTIQTMNLGAVKIAYDLINTINREINNRGFTMGHLKYFVNSENQWHRKVSFDHLHPEKLDIPPVPSNAVELIINARVQCDTKPLLEIMRSIIQNTALNGKHKITVQQAYCFSPGFPTPLYRIQSIERQLPKPTE